MHTLRTLAATIGRACRRSAPLDVAAPAPVPEAVRNAIIAAESERLRMPEEDMSVEYAAYFARYCTCSPGYVGPLVVVCWAASPGALSSFIQRNGTWEHCNSSSW